MPSSSRLQSPASSLYPWLVLAVLTILNVVNFVDRQLVVSLQVPLKADSALNLDDIKIQLLAGYSFAVVYSIAGMYLGSIADRWHRPRLIALGLLVWSAMTAASGLAQTFWHFALARTLVAIGEATLTPAAVAMIGDIFSPQRRSLASGVYYLGIPLGAGLSYIVSSRLEQIPGVGWRGCFFLLGLFGLLLVGVVAFIKDPRGDVERVTAPSPALASPPSNVPQSQLSQGEPRSGLLVTLRQSPALVMTMIGAIAINIGVGTTWLDPSWMVVERHFEKSHAPLFLGTIFLFGGSCGNLLGGWLGDMFHRHWEGGRLLALVCVHLAITPFSILFRFVAPESFLFPVSYFVGSIFVTMMYGPVLATVQELTPVRQRARMIALLVMGLNILGASLGGMLAAYLTRRLGSYTWGIFLTAQISLIAIPMFLLAVRSIRRDAARLQRAAE